MRWSQDSLHDFKKAMAGYKAFIIKGLSNRMFDDANTTQKPKLKKMIVKTF